MQVLMLGLPSSGKTTFLAALWHVVTAGDVPGSLKLETVGPHAEYLNSIHADWLNGRQTGRTSTAVTVSSTMTLLAGRDSGNEVVVPDLSGEHARSAFKERAWPPELSELVRSADGVLLFAHSEEIFPPARIADAISILGAAPIGEVAEPIPWDAEKSPTVVKLVELLQMVAWSRSGPQAARVAVIASAWDKVDRNFRTPNEWLSGELSLLEQYLRTNESAFQWRVFGVSAQGGELPKDRAKLLRKSRSSERIRVVVEGEETNDITAPLKWALSI